LPKLLEDVKKVGAHDGGGHGVVVDMAADGHCRDGSDATENDDISHVEEESSTTSGTGDDDSDDEPSVSSPDFSPRMEMAAHKQEDGGGHESMML